MQSNGHSPDPILEPARRISRPAVGAAARVLTLAAGAVGCMAIGAPVAAAQAVGAPPPGARLAGMAVSLAGERIVGAQATLVGSASRPAVTAEDGTFEMLVLNDSAPRLVLRRIGFRPETVLVQLPQPVTPPLVVRMARAIQMVRPVVVNATAVSANSNLAAVRERERTGGNGHFVYRAEFMKSNPARFSDVLRRIPGIRIGRTTRNATDVRLRGNRCGPLYWLDGQPLVGVPFDPDAIPPQTVEAIEVYSSAALVPARFQGPQYAQGCGAIVIWTRQGERPIRQPRIDADSLMRLLDAQRLFMASEVDQPARVVSLQQPDYPDSLRAAGVSGSAVIEFIIDAEGKLDRESIGVVSATHLPFADAVRLAVFEATFVAAMKNGRNVAQVYQLPVTFTAPGKP